MASKWTVESDFQFINHIGLKRDRPEWTWESRDTYWAITNRHEYKNDKRDPDGKIRAADLPYNEARAILAFLRWDLESTNGYKFVYVTRDPDGTVNYHMLRWGAPTCIFARMFRQS